jgi:hypothetical protein
MSSWLSTCQYNLILKINHSYFSALMLYSYQREIAGKSFIDSLSKTGLLNFSYFERILSRVEYVGNSNTAFWLVNSIDYFVAFSFSFFKHFFYSAYNVLVL